MRRGRIAMENVTVKKAELLTRLAENRDAHREQFLQAQSKYREAVIDTLDARLQAARDGKKIDLFFHLPEPQDFTNSYDAAIEMLKWSVDDEITLGEHEFRQLVLNQWDWAQQFAASTQAYLVG